MAAPDILPPKGVRPPIIGPGQTFGTITDRIAGIVLTKHTPVFWVLIVAVAAAIFGMLQTAVAYLLAKGTGIWGINIPVGWGFAIVNFVWWIGIGHAGT
ncbi:MAG: hydrogenase, partial [Terriglobales bacterium]